MKLGEVFPEAGIDSRFKSTVVKGISDDSRAVKEGDVFFAAERRNFDIFSVLKDVENKVSAVAGDLSLKDKLKKTVKRKPLILVKDIEKEFLRAVDLFYGLKKESLKFIGITGTNGKTTTAFLIYYLLKRLGEKPSLIGTIKYIVGSKEYKAGRTTPGFLVLRKVLKKIEENGSGFAVMEVSSHAIAQRRIKGIEFSRCVFTNLSRDHLDYHKTMDSYFNTKKELFLGNEGAVSLVNIDDSYGKAIFKELGSKFSYGTGPEAGFRAADIRLRKEGLCFELIYLGKSYTVASKLCGRHNVSNILAALSVVVSLGFSLSEAVKFIPDFSGPDGRLERIKKRIFVDYAHTPDALENVLSALKESGYEKIICVFGCGGDRDKGKRAVMGKIACERADFSFITSDNPRGEEPLKICSQIEEGFSLKNYSIVPERKKAIKQALEMFKKNLNACLLVAGKGHEDYQIIDGKRILFKDSEVIRELLTRNT